jgi:hypothetical protein
MLSMEQKVNIFCYCKIKGLPIYLVVTFYSTFWYDNAWLRTSYVQTDPDPRSVITKKKRCMQLQSDRDHTCPCHGLALGSTCGHSLGVGCMRRVRPLHARCDQRVHGDLKERMTSPGSS